MKKDVIIKFRYVFILAIPLALYLFAGSFGVALFGNPVLYQFLALALLSALVGLAVKGFSWNKDKIVAIQGTSGKSRVLIFRTILGIFLLWCILYIIRDFLMIEFKYMEFLFNF